jgi:hypothetical protein
MRWEAGLPLVSAATDNYIALMPFIAAGYLFWSVTVTQAAGRAGRSKREKKG